MTPQKKMAESLAENINQEKLENPEVQPSSHESTYSEPCSFFKTVSDIIFLPFKVAGKGLNDVIPVAIGFLKIPVIFIEIPIQIFKDLGRTANEMGKAIVPPEKPTVK